MSHLDRSWALRDTFIFVCDDAEVNSRETLQSEEKFIRARGDDENFPCVGMRFFLTKIS